MQLLIYTDLVAAVLNGCILMAIVVLARRHGVLRSPVAFGVIAFFALRVLSRLNDSPNVLLRDDPQLELVLDTASVIVLGFLLSQVGRFASVMRAMFDEASFRADEYERARRHYTQVVRHRVMNPVTVIKGSAQTMRAGVAMTDETREQICDAIIVMAEQIEHVALGPERRDTLERGLDAIPQVQDRRRMLDGSSR